MSADQPNVCIGISNCADFDEMTWTFSFTERFAVGGGRYAILREDDFIEIQARQNELLNAQNELLNALIYVQQQVESGQEIAMSRVNEAIRRATA